MCECYLRSVPSVDLNNVTSENLIDCCNHRLSESEYNRILQEFGVTDEYGNTLQHDIMAACGMWMLQSGPSIKRD